MSNEAVELIQPFPVPQSFNVQGRRDDNGMLVVILQIFSPTGQSVNFMDAPTAAQVGKMLTEAATGIILPGVDRIRENGRYTPPKGSG